MLEVGKLYICKDFFLLLYSDKEAAAASAPATAVAVAGAATAAAYFSRELGKPVSHCNPETPLLVLNTDNEYVEFLAGDKRGWIINQEWLKIEEIPCP